MRVFIQKDLFDYTEIESNPDHWCNVITGRLLMDVYFEIVPVFRINMGLSIDDDHMVCRIKYGDDVAVFTQMYSDLKRRAGRWRPEAYFAGNAIHNFCNVFKLPHMDVNAHFSKRRETR